jgi:hypothetical protein
MPGDLKIFISFKEKRHSKWYYNKGKGKMASRRGKSTRYFCNLEKRHYLGKTIPNLILDNDTETSDQNVIQSVLQLFYLFSRLQK